jgi:hypothetical protein
MKLSERARNLSPSEPRRIYDEAQKYTGVIDLTLGDAACGKTAASAKCPMSKSEYLEKMHGFSSCRQFGSGNR